MYDTHADHCCKRMAHVDRGCEIVAGVVSRSPGSLAVSSPRLFVQKSRRSNGLSREKQRTRIPQFSRPRSRGFRLAGNAFPVPSIRSFTLPAEHFSESSLHYAIRFGEYDFTTIQIDSRIQFCDFKSTC